MKMYLAGPMSGYPQFNYPAFYAAAEDLRSRGYDVLCPAEMDTPEMQNAAMMSKTGNIADLADTGETWGDVLAKDVKLIADEVDGIILLDGWAESRGARLEAFVALTVGKPIYRYTMIDGDVYLFPFQENDVMGIIGANTLDQGDVSRYDK